jgi:hypothetical protein
LNENEGGVLVILWKSGRDEVNDGGRDVWDIFRGEDNVVVWSCFLF